MLTQYDLIFIYDLYDIYKFYFFKLGEKFAEKQKLECFSCKHKYFQ